MPRKKSGGARGARRGIFRGALFLHALKPMPLRTRADALPRLATLHTPRVYAAVVGATLLTVLLALMGAVPDGSAAFVLLMGVMLVVGIPHGAVDHLVFYRLYRLEPTGRDRLVFYGAYLALMALYGALWLVFPVACLLFFLAITVYHFGQAEMEPLGLRGPQRVALHLSRGLLVIGLPVAVHPDAVAPIFEAIAGGALPGWDLLGRHQGLAGLVAVGQHVLFFGALAGAAARRQGRLGREALSIGVLAALFWTTTPLVAFAVYFGLWHALGHILELRRFFARQSGAGRAPASWTGFYRAAALFTFLSLAGLAALYLAARALESQERMVALLFILISVLTLPHLLLVEAFYQKRRQAANEGRQARG